MRRALIVFLLAGLAAPAAAQQPPEMKPVSEIAGRTFEQWLKDITHKDPSKRELAIRSVMMFGPERAAEALPALLAELRRHSPSYPIDTSVRVNIAMALGPIVATAKKLDPKQQEEAVRLLTRLLSDPQDIVQYRAAQSLGLIGGEARSAMAALVPLLRDTSAWEVRQAAATALGQMAFDPKTGPPPAVLNALYDRIKEDPALQVRLASIQALAMAGPTTDINHRVGMIKVIEPLVRKDTEPAIQIWAHMALMSLQGKITDNHVDQISKLLHKGDLLTRTQAAQAIGTVGVRAKDTVPALTSGLADVDPTVQMWIVWALSRMEEHAAPAIPQLEKLAADPKSSDQLKKAAKMSVESIKKAKSGTQK
jgi:HEAT repeat protein